MILDPQDVAELANPNGLEALGELLRAADDVDAVREGGLAAFVRAAWSEVEAAPLRWNWHHDVICDRLERVARGEIRWLLIEVPPGTTKTLIASYFFPAWLWTFAPHTRLIVVSYSDVALDAARGHRDLVNGPWFRQRWPGCHIPYQNTKAASAFRNNLGGVRFTTTVGGAMTGRHAHGHIGDDLNKAQDAMGGAAYSQTQLEKSWDTWEGVLSSRQADPATTWRVLIGQRLHVADCPGRWVEKYGDAIHVLCLPMHRDSTHPHACPPTRGKPGDPDYMPGDDREDGELLWPEHIPEAEAKRLAEALGPRDAAAQLEQSPIPFGGSVFRAEWLRQFFRTDHLGLEWKGASPRWIQSWDLNIEETSDGSFVSGGVWAQVGDEVYRVDGVRGRWEFTVACDHLVDLTLKWPESSREVVIEKKANGPAMASFLERYYRDECRRRGVDSPPPLEVRLYNPGGSKLARANGITGIVSGRHVHLPEDAPWLAAYLDELLKFTGKGGETDDQVDETSQALTYLYGSQADRFADAMKRAREAMRGPRRAA